MNKKILLIIFCIAFTLSIILISLRLVAFGKANYIENFRENNIYEQLPDAEARLDNLISYMKTNQPLNPEYYNEKEIQHMKDVKRIIDIAALTLLLSMTFSGVYIARKWKDKQMWKSLIIAGIASLCSLLLLALLSLNFDTFFTTFHKIFFTNNSWILDPRTDMLIVMLPESFFRNALTKVFIIASILSVIAIAVGLIKKHVHK